MCKWKFAKKRRRQQWEMDTNCSQCVRKGQARGKRRGKCAMMVWRTWQQSCMEPNIKIEKSIRPQRVADQWKNLHSKWAKLWGEHFPGKLGSVTKTKKEKRGKTANGGMGWWGGMGWKNPGTLVTQCHLHTHSWIWSSWRRKLPGSVANCDDSNMHYPAIRRTRADRDMSAPGLGRRQMQIETQLKWQKWIRLDVAG